MRVVLPEPERPTRPMRSPGFMDIEKFAQYGFNKAHAYAYGLITYSLLYYKTFFPIEFYSTALEMESFSSYKVTAMIDELKKRHLKMKNPNINLSLKNQYRFMDSDIYLPLSIAAHGDKLIEDIMMEMDDSREDVREMTIYTMLQRAIYNRLNKDMTDYNKRMDIILADLKDEFRDQIV